MSITEQEFEQLKTRRKVATKTNLERLVEEARTAKPRVIKLTLPFPPPSNNIYAAYGTRRILSQRGREYKANVLAICFANRVKPFVGEVAVEIKAYRPRKISDLDNMFKILLDSLTGSAYLDDKQVKRISAERFDDKSNPRVEIEISKVLDSEYLR